MMQKRINLFIALSVLLFLGVLTFCVYAENYHRDAFVHWSDTDHDGFDARQQAMKVQSLTNVSAMKTPRGYIVISGIWKCPYNGFTSSKPHDFEVDHVVSLADAWRRGAEHWKPYLRKQFANDQENLLVVSVKGHDTKGDKGPDEWLPQNIEYHAEYKRKWSHIIKKYGLEE